MLQQNWLTDEFLCEARSNFDALQLVLLWCEESDILCDRMPRAEGAICSDETPFILCHVVTTALPHTCQIRHIWKLFRFHRVDQKLRLSLSRDAFEVTSETIRHHYSIR